MSGPSPTPTPTPGPIQGAPDLSIVDQFTQFVGATQANWNNTTTPVPSGVVVYASDSTVVKMGDGATLYTNLPTLFTINQINSIVNAANVSAAAASAAQAEATTSAAAAATSAALSLSNSIRIAGVYSSSDSTAVGDGVTDDAAALNTFLATLVHGAVVYLAAGKKYLISGTNLNIPAGITLLGAGSPLSKTVANTLIAPATIIVGLNVTINFGERCQLKSVLVYQQGLPAIPTDSVAVAEVATWPTNGVGLTVVNDGCVFEDLLILGFRIGMKTQTGRFLPTNVWMDNYINIEAGQAGDVVHIDKVRCEPFWSISSTNANNGGVARPGFGFYFVGGGAFYLRNCFTFMFANPIVVSDTSSVFVQMCGSEWHNSFGNGITNTVSYRWIGHNSQAEVCGFWANGDWARAVSIEGPGDCCITDINLPGATNIGIYCAGQSAVPSLITISGTYVVGNTVSLVITTSAVADSPVTLTYTTVTGDTGSSVAIALTKLVNRHQSFISGRICAVTSGLTTSIFWPQEISVSVAASNVGTTIATVSTGTALPGSNGIIRGLDMASATAPGIQFGDTVGLTNRWVVDGLINDPSVGMHPSFLSCPNSANQLLVSISGMPPRPHGTGISFGGISSAITGTDKNGSIVIGSGTITSGTFNFNVPYPWAPTSVMVNTNNPGLAASVTTITPSSFTVTFSSNAAGVTLYYDVLFG